LTETTVGARGGVVARISAWVRRRQSELCARVHAAGDERARRHGWTVTETTGRFGVGTRVYRDPRFDDRRRQLSARAGPHRTRGKTARTTEAEE
jgi:hypothetical protein